MIKTEIGLKNVCFSSFSWKIWLKHVKKEENSQSKQGKPPKSLFHLVGEFCVKKHTEHGLLRTILKSKFNLVSCIQVFRLRYQIIPFIVSSGSLSNSRKWLVTNSYDFCPLISHSFFVFRFSKDPTLLSNELWLKPSIPSFITGSRPSSPPRFRER